jgi:DNA (cytosine-5)-methyltransferase 1
MFDLVSRKSSGFQVLATFKFIDLFAGIGGLRIPFEELGGECVFTSELDPHARETYLLNFSASHSIDKDISTADLVQIPEHDLVLAGFPCQPFSHAGKRQGFADTRGTLFFYIAEIARLHRPKALLLENVRGLLNHDQGNTFKRILETLDELGYGVEFKVLNARDYGLPQNRQRIFIVALRNDIKVKFVFPEPTHKRENLKLGQILDKNPSEKLTISDRLWEGHKERKIRNKAAGKGFGYQLFNGESNYAATISARYYKDGSEILIEQRNNNPRKLSVNEARRLQGFPEGFRFCKSEMQSYKQCGNAVPVAVVRAIAGALIKYL